MSKSQYHVYHNGEHVVNVVASFVGRACELAAIKLSVGSGELTAVRAVDTNPTLEEAAKKRSLELFAQARAV